MAAPPDAPLSDPAGLPPARPAARLHPLRLHPALRTGRRLAEELAERDRAPRLATGIGAVDRLLAGGFPRGRLSEITGPLGSGRTSLAVALAAAATRAGEVVAWVDPPDALDSGSLEAAGVALERLLWVRPSRTGDVLRCAERLLLARGFALVVLDLHPGAGGGLRLDARAGAWLRLARCAAASATALVLLGREPALGSFSALAVDLRATRRRFAECPAWLEGLEARVALTHQRLRPPGDRSGATGSAAGAGSTEGFAPVCWKVPPVAPDRPEPDEDAS